MPADKTPADLLREAHEAVGKAISLRGWATTTVCDDLLREAHAAIDRAVEEAKSVIPAGPVLHIVHAALSKRDAAWRELHELFIDMLEAPGRHVTEWDGGWTQEVIDAIIKEVRAQLKAIRSGK